MLTCAIYNVILLCIIFSSYYSLFTLHRSFYPKCNIMLLFLNRARVDNNRSGRVSNYISFARNCILTIFFLLRHVLMNQTTRQGSDIPSPQNKESSQTFSDLNTTEGVSVYTTLDAREEESSYEVLGESSNT